ncbi:MAG: hypothetical protein JSV27_12480 [Candidatus Bathyarchaeota archaeon]|nr:MAG: hypothetical protein JSV27_12480 [Candidatus Bathyarchaeota archaeon]
MKYVGFWKFDSEALDVIVEKSVRSSRERDVFPEKYPEIICGPFILDGESRGFTVYDVDDLEQLTNVTAHYGPEMTYEFKPIVETSKYAEFHLRKG